MINNYLLFIAIIIIVVTLVVTLVVKLAFHEPDDTTWVG